MNIIYKITYMPHLGTNYPKYYIGSKYNYKNNYYGSVSSTQIFNFTEGLKLKDWWKKELKNLDNFKFEIIKILPDDISPFKLVEIEKEIHLKFNVRESNEYFNQAIATKGWVSISKTNETKQRMSESTKKYWNSSEGQLKKERLSARNRKIKSKEMKDKWKNNPSESMLKHIQKISKQSPSKLTKEKMSIAKTEWWKNNKDMVSKNWKILTPDSTIDVLNLKEYCKNNNLPYGTFLKNSKSNVPISRGKYKNWKVINEDSLNK